MFLFIIGARKTEIVYTISKFAGNRKDKIRREISNVKDNFFFLQFNSCK